MSLFNRANRKLKLFVLTRRDDPNRFLCISLTKKDILEYAHALLKFEHKPHFESWCLLRGYDPNDSKSWDKYFNICVNTVDTPTYIITNVSYKLQDVVAILRMFGGCAPIGCSFETDIEYTHAKKKREAIECQVEFEKFWRENHPEEVEENLDGIK